MAYPPFREAEVGELELESCLFERLSLMATSSSATSRRDVSKWDSLQHVALVAAIEQQFGISMSMDEMVEMRSVKDICNILYRHGV